MDREAASHWEGVELTSYVQPGGRLPPEDRDTLRSVLLRGVGKRVAITIQEVEDTRSARQNRYYWGVVVKLWHKHIVDKGNLHVKRGDVHNWLKQSVGGAFFFDQITLDGKVSPFIKSSAKLPRRKFYDWVEACRALAAEHQLDIPAPRKQDYE